MTARITGNKKLRAYANECIRSVLWYGLFLGAFGCVGSGFDALFALG
ncbi:hypothetical protein Rumal_2901 [Ruminococcus albus 7 = DSM 20455]|uniref:Uncharacterized protein n=1 Tax=Ruminococcus albus (strain ATCC 27210 / DSM 20455 / JCM 14654 / NCDO 2250 / 7) TaxID=697329 RepID=E6UIM2_RUMA7|nr:hypothetical protein Rumal_2901 [Ruminococcus albus 7 = DSM 20455]